MKKLLSIAKIINTQIIIDISNIPMINWPSLWTHIRWGSNEYHHSFDGERHQPHSECVCSYL